MTLASLVMVPVCSTVQVIVRCAMVLAGRFPIVQIPVVESYDPKSAEDDT